MTAQFTRTFQFSKSRQDFFFSPNLIHTAVIFSRKTHFSVKITFFDGFNEFRDDLYTKYDGNFTGNTNLMVLILESWCISYIFMFFYIIQCKMPKKLPISMMKNSVVIPEEHKIAKKASPWVSHVREWSKAHNKSSFSSLKEPDCKNSYHSKK